MGTIYENGTTLSDQERMTVTASAVTQEEKVKRFFAWTTKHYTAEEVHRLLFPDGLLSSTRRTLSTLTKEGELEKLKDNKKPGSNGVQLVTYRKAIKKYDTI